MSLHLLALGVLTADPQSRTAKTGSIYATASIRVATGEGESLFIDIIAFNDQAPELLSHRQGSAVAVAGSATMRSWVGRDGTDRQGLSVVVEQCASAASARRAEAARRRDNAADGGD